MTDLIRLPVPTEAVRPLLRWMLERGSDPARIALLQQSDVAVVSSEEPYEICLTVPRDAPRANPLQNPWEISASVVGPYREDAAVLNLWFADGSIDSLDYSWFEDSPPKSIPTPATLSVLSDRARDSSQNE